MTEQERPRIKIVSVPSGEAPDWVREQWINTTIPLAMGIYGNLIFQKLGKVLSLTQGVETRKPKKNPGYPVFTQEALSALSRGGNERSAEAVEYWNKTLDKFGPITERSVLIFNHESAVLLDDKDKQTE